ncbi:hypothetical protein ACFC1R_13920 [Kitasatospora sp. NPDC056138]|uniref:hypothetical protein n=1 Tax=Kitasatospora sp. NPDC056138 TaxID=3345724 RepID=UPI0035DFF875
MADGQFDIKPWELQGEGREFESISNDFARASMALSSGLEALGEPWGDDQIGEYFGTVYKGARDGIVESMDHLSEQIGKIGDGLQQMADAVSSTDEQLSAGLDQVY